MEGTLFSPTRLATPRGCTVRRNPKNKKGTVRACSSACGVYCSIHLHLRCTAVVSHALSQQPVIEQTTWGAPASLCEAENRAQVSFLDSLPYTTANCQFLNGASSTQPQQDERYYDRRSSLSVFPTKNAAMTPSHTPLYEHAGTTACSLDAQIKAAVPDLGREK